MRAIIASSHDDEQGTLSEEAIGRMAIESGGKTFSLLDNFDVRLPPLGRATIIGTERLEDGCLGLVAEVETEKPMEGIALGFAHERDSPGTDAIANARMISVSATVKPSDEHCRLGRE